MESMRVLCMGWRGCGGVVRSTAPLPATHPLVMCDCVWYIQLTDSSTISFYRIHPNSSFFFFFFRLLLLLPQRNFLRVFWRVGRLLVAKVFSEEGFYLLVILLRGLQGLFNIL